MDCLPEIVLLKVFSFLPVADLGRAAKVCSDWRRLAYDHTLWKAVNIKRQAAKLDEDTLHMLIRTRFSHSLSILHLGGCKISLELLSELNRKCKSLKYLIFSRGSKLRPPSPPPKYTEVTYEFPSQLELVELRPIKGDFAFLGRISRHFCEVKYLGVGNNSSKGAVPAMFSKMQRLVILDCTNCDTITDEVIGKVAECCPLLESFCLNGCKYIYGRTFCTLFRSCSRLRTILLRYTPVRDDCFVIPEWKYVPVEELDISACSNITQIGLISLVTHVKTLRYLNLSYCGVGRAVTDSVLLQMARLETGTNLEMLDVRWSLTLTPEALYILSRSCPKLKCLGVYQSSSINPSAMAEVLRMLPKLEVLEYGAFGKASISESMFFPNLIRHCESLEAVSLINFASMDSVADAVLMNALVENCRCLKRINLCEPDPTLLDLVQELPPSSRAKVTQRWQCVLPPPDHTLDAIIARLKYNPPHPPHP